MSINRFIVVLVALAALVTPTLAQHPISAQAATPASPAAVITWNGIARRTAIQVAGQTTAHAMTSIAFAQAAVYDAVVAIEGGYQPYQVRLAQLPDASLDAAVATAAHHVLVHYFPAQQAALDADYATALAAVPDGAAKAAGIAVGQATAAGIIARRQGDGLEADIGFTMPAPGAGSLAAARGPEPDDPVGLEAATLPAAAAQISSGQARPRHSPVVPGPPISTKSRPSAASTAHPAPPNRPTSRGSGPPTQSCSTTPRSRRSRWIAGSTPSRRHDCSRWATWSAPTR